MLSDKTDVLVQRLLSRELYTLTRFSVALLDLPEIVKAIRFAFVTTLTFNIIINLTLLLSRSLVRLSFSLSLSLGKTKTIPDQVYSIWWIRRGNEKE